MIISNWKVYDLPESVKASKYPMLTDTSEVDEVLTERTRSLALSPKGEGHDQFLTGIRVNFDLTFKVKAWTEA